MRLVLSALAVGSAVAACSDAPGFLLFPPELLDGSYASAILLLQARPALDSAVLEAHLLSLPPMEHFRFPIEESANLRFRLMAYSSTPFELALETGPLQSANPGEGLPLPEPQAAYLSPPLTEGLLSWSSMDTVSAEAIPWRRPGEAPTTECRDAQTRAWLIPGLELVEPRALLAVDANEAVIAGQRTPPGAVELQETILVRISNLDSNPQVEELAPTMSGQEYRGAIWLDDRSLLASTNQGWLTRVNLDTGETRSESVMGGFGRWELSRGDDGTVVAFDAYAAGRTEPRRPSWLVDSETFDATVLDSPEPFSAVAVVSRDFMVAAGASTLYRFEDGAWVAEHSIEHQVSTLERLGDRFVAVLNRTITLERGPSGAWSEVANPLMSFDLSSSAFLSGGRLLLGGGAGFVVQYYQDGWCLLPRALSRAARALAPVDANTALAATYSQVAGEQVGISRITFDP